MAGDREGRRCGTARVAEISGLSPRDVRRWAAQGWLPSAAREGNVWTFEEKTIQAWNGEFQYIRRKAEAAAEQVYEQASGLRRGNILQFPGKKRAPRSREI